MKKRTIKLFDPKIDFIEKRNVESVFDSHNWASGSGSNFVNSFEKKFIKYNTLLAWFIINLLPGRVKFNNIKYGF